MASYRSAILNVLNGNLFSQLIAIASYPILVRIYSPQDFGAYSTFISLVSLFSAISLLRVDRLMYKWSGDYDRIEAAYGACTVLSLVFAFFSLIVAIPVYLPHATSSINLVFFACFVGCGVLFSSYNVLQMFLLIEHSLYKLNTRSLILKAIAVLFSQIFLACINIKYGLLAGYILGAIACFVYVNKKLGSDVVPILRSKRRRWTDLLCIVRESSTFLLFSNAQSILNSFNNNIALLVVGSVFGLKTAGFYLMADRICRLPINLISNSLRQVLTKVFSSHVPETEGVAYSRRLSVLIGCVALPIVIAIPLFSEKFAVFAFGVQWTKVASILNVLVWWAFLNLIASPYQTNVFVNRTKVLFGIELLHFFLKCVAVFWTFFSHNFESALILFALASIAYYLAVIIYSEFFLARGKSGLVSSRLVN